MPALVPTLASSLAQADAWFAAGRVGVARQAFGELVERAQDKSDRATEGIARSMLAWCALKARDLDGARDALRAAVDRIDPGHHEAYGRYRRVLARLAIEASDRPTALQETRDYLEWAEQADRPVESLDACLLIAGLSDVQDRVEWLERGIERAVRSGGSRDLGRAYNALGAALDQLDRADDALEAYQQALRWQSERHPQGTRPVVAATWAVGAAACRTEAWPLAQDSLEQALAMALHDTECADLVGWVRAGSGPGVRGCRRRGGRPPRARGCTRGGAGAGAGCPVARALRGPVGPGRRPRDHLTSGGPAALSSGWSFQIRSPG